MNDAPSDAPLSDESPLRIEESEGGQLWTLTLDTAPANIIDSAMIRRLHGAFRAAADAPELKCIILQGEGKHFSFGASVEEHLPDQVGDMLPAFHRMFEAMFDANVPTLAAVTGQCLGGGLEVVAACTRVFAAPTAKLGQPEIVLGVLAPVASVILAERTGRGPAMDLCVSGRSVSGEEALRMGLVDEVADDPEAAALAYARENLLPRSASSLRLAMEAAQIGFRERFATGLQRAERLYLGDLMRTHDAVEGIQAFVEKRKPTWRNA